MGWYDNASNEDQEAFRRDMERHGHDGPVLQPGRHFLVEIDELKKENKKLKEEIKRLKRRLGE